MIWVNWPERQQSRTLASKDRFLSNSQLYEFQQVSPSGPVTHRLCQFGDALLWIIPRLCIKSAAALASARKQPLTNPVPGKLVGRAAAAIAPIARPAYAQQSHLVIPFVHDTVALGQLP